MNTDSELPTLPMGVLNALNRLDGDEHAGMLSYIVSLQRRDDKANRKLRQTWILESIDFIPQLSQVNSQILTLWKDKLTEEERKDSQIVYKMLEYSITHRVFGINPWSETYDPESECLLPSGFDQDPKAFLAFTRNRCFNRFYLGTYEIPTIFRDNFTVVKAACSKISSCLQYASPRLKDDEDFVRTALFSDEGDLMKAFEYASDRLKNDIVFIDDLMVTFCSKKYDGWKREYSWGWLEYVLPGSFDVQQTKDFLAHIPAPELSSAMLHFPTIIKDNVEIMSEVISQAGETEAKEIFSYCTEKVQEDKMMVHAMKEKIGADYFDAWSQVDDGDKNTLLAQIAAKEVKCLDDISMEMRLDSDVIQAAVKYGILHDRDSVLSFIKKLDKLKFDYYDIEEIAERIYSSLPTKLQEDEAIARAFMFDLPCYFDFIKDILNRVSSLTQSKETLMKVFAMDLDEESCDSYNFLAKCPRQYLRDKEFMRAAVRRQGDNLEYADDQLLSDREFMLSLSELPNALFITYATPDFQLSNLDLVEKAIGNIGEAGICPELVFESMLPQVWTRRSVIMTWVKNGSLRYLKEYYPKNSFLNDKEIVSLSVVDRPSDFAHASIELRSDRGFVLQLAKKGCKILRHSAKELLFDEEIAVLLLSGDADSIVNCFDPLQSSRDMEFLLEFSLKIRLKLHLHGIFLKFLHGMITREKHDRRHPSHRCHLPKLDQGVETSLDFKILVADFLGAPVGEDYVRYKNASLALERFGFF